MRLRTLILVIILALVLPAASEAGVRIIWLQRGKGKDTFERGFDMLKDKLASQSGRTQDLLWDVMKVNVEDQRISFDKNTLKLNVYLEGRASAERNTNTTCASLISKARAVLLGTTPFTSLNQYFPGVKQEDLRYFLYLHGKVETRIDTDTDKEIPADEAFNPDRSKVTISTLCRANSVSDSVSYRDGLLEEDSF